MVTIVTIDYQNRPGHDITLVPHCKMSKSLHTLIFWN